MHTCLDIGEETEKSKARNLEFAEMRDNEGGREEFGESWYCIFQNFAWQQR